MVSSDRSSNLLAGMPGEFRVENVCLETIFGLACHVFLSLSLFSVTHRSALFRLTVVNPDITTP